MSKKGVKKVVKKIETKFYYNVNIQNNNQQPTH